MTPIPNPWLTEPAESLSHVSAEGEAAAVIQSEPAPAAAADPAPPDDTCHIHEIFHFARKLMGRDEHRFVLDEAAFADAIEELPLFLRQSHG